MHHLKPGDLVHMLIPHRDTQTFVPENSPPAAGSRRCRWVLPEQAIILALAGVALAAIHDPRIKVGDRVTIFGLGTIGLLAVQLARLAGAGWIDAIDLYPSAASWRRGSALTGRSTRPHATWHTRSRRRATTTARCRHRAVGASAALNEAIRAVRMAGTVVAGGLPGRHNGVAAGRGVAS